MIEEIISVCFFRRVFNGKNDALLEASRRILYGYLDLPNSPNMEYHLPIVEIDGKK
jgi:hypothetical protein